ncbi:sialate O-acetylesterase [Cupriavidus basilensis]
MSTANEYITALERIVTNELKWQQFLNGPATGPDSLVQTDDGPVKTIARIVSEVPSAQADRVAAEIASAAAAAQATTAQLQAIVAQTAKTSAEAARDVAQLSAGVYATTAAGLAATTSGKFFSVPSSSASEYLSLYRNDSGVATYLKSYPSASAVTSTPAALSDSGQRIYSGSGAMAPIAADSSGRVVLYVDGPTGNVVAKGLASSAAVATQADAASKSVLAQNSMMQYSMAGAILPIVVDSLFQVRFGYDATKDRIIGTVGPQYKVNPPESLAFVLAPKGWNHVIVYGQSNGVGSYATPVISTSQPYSGITFAGGPRSSKAGSVGGNPGTGSTISLIENTAIADGGSAGTEGESACSSAANYAVEIMAEQTGQLPSSHVIFASNAAHGGYNMAQLSKGAAWYQLLLDQASEAHALAAAAGKTHAVHVVTWQQGEANVSLATTQAAYRTAMDALQADIETDIKAITGQTSPVMLLTYQTVWNVATFPDIALAQLDAARSNGKITLTTPVYHLPHVVDNIHLTNVGQHLLGKYIGRAYASVMAGKKAPHIYPVSATLRGQALKVRFFVPYAPLVLDVRTLAATQDYGFRVVDSSGTVPISSATIGADGETVEFVLGRATTGTVSVKYALDYLGAGLSITGGASGNLRDSNQEVCTVSGSTYHLWSVCPHFSLNAITLG